MTKNSKISSLSCFAGGFAMEEWLGWHGLVAYVTGGLIFGIGTAVNAVRRGL